jgi:hypothetical protein
MGMKRLTSSEYRKRHKHLIGTIFGKTQIVELKESCSDSKLRVVCKCLNCGEITERRYDHVRKDFPQHCIKCQKETSKKPQETTPFNGHYCAIRTGANQRGIEWKLSKEEFSIITKQDCFYCGQPPTQDPTHGKNGRCKQHFCEYLSNGVDRIDSKKGYSIENVVPCCRVCNIMKNKFSLELFFDKVEKIYNKHIRERSTTSRKT